MLKKVFLLLSTLSLFSLIYISCGRDEKEANISVSSVNVNPASSDLLVGETLTLQIEVLPEDATGYTISLVSSDPTVATVSDKGVVSALKKGTVTITVDAGGKKATCKINVIEKTIPVSSVKVEPGEVTIVEGETFNLVAKVQPDNATDKSVVWSSSDDNIVKVSSEGIVAAINIGEATVKATSGDKFSSCKVTVLKKTVPVESIVIEPSELSLVEGEEFTLKAVVLPENATDKTISWSSSDEDVLEISSEGVVTAKKPGNAAVTAVSGDKSAKCEVTVEMKIIAVESVVIEPSELTLVEGDEYTLKATVLPENATDKTVSWTSSDEEVLIISSEGKVMAKKPGNASVTAVSGDKSAKCEITVNKKIIHVESVSLEPVSLELHEGDASSLKATVYPSDATDQSISWTSSDESVVTVSQEGEVQAVSIGKAVITVYTADGNFTATCEINVAPLDNVIYYKTTDGKTISPSNPSSVGSFVSNTYSNGWGRMFFNEPVKTIGDDAFKEIVTLKEFIIPGTVTSIGDRAFESCSSLVSVTVPASVKAVGVRAFHLCPNLEQFECEKTIWDSHGLSIGEVLVGFAPAGITEFVLSPTLTKITDEVFEDCTELEKIELPSSISVIGDYAFAGCTSLKTVIAPRHDPPFLGPHAFDRIDTDYWIHVAAGCEEKYKAADGWHNYESHIKTMEYSERSKAPGKKRM